MQATNYCSGLNRQVKAKSQRYVVRAIYADAALNVEYLYRTLAGAQSQLAYLERMIADDARRSLGEGRNREIPMIGASMEAK